MASGGFVDFFRKQKLSGELLKKLETTYLTVNAVLEDAEELQVTKPAVRRWLDELKDAVYDAEHVLDEIATQALQSELDAEFQTTASKVQKSIFAFRNSFVEEIKPMIQKIVGRLESLARQKKTIGLTEGGGGKSSEIFATSSLVEESDICGRNDEKDAIINLLLSNEARGNEMSVIAIVGMGGIGKTTLAQLLYNDKRVKEYFDLDAWVYVSKEVDVTKVTKKIMDELSLSTDDTDDIMSLNQLQLTLKKKLTGKKFLIVLDDVWNENYVNWEDLSKPLKSGAQGSKVIVTTRDHEVALVMRASSTHPLKKLREEDCRSLFTKHAFYDGNPNAHPQLEELGRQIVEKCDGLPLAIKAIGDLLRYELDVDEWNKILKSDLWDLPIDKTKILPALKLSYKYLPSHLKRCFAYCSIFPKNYIFKKNKLVLLWMAEGFLHESKNMTMEEVGDNYFSALVSRSLFQQSSGNKSLFTMHDLVNDLATFVSGKFNLRMEGDYSGENANKVRHLSYVREEFDGFKKFEALYKTKLCTFLPIDLSHSYFSYLTKKVPHELLPMLKCLRVLSLSLYRNMTELPDLIGKLTHLRYLDLSSTRVQKLPDSIYKLCNLQTLILSQCGMLIALPSDMWKLVSLRHLDITGTRITEMPIQLGRLKCLQTLTKFIVGKGSGSCIEELGKLTNLRGSLSILKLQNVESSIDALDASLRNKKYLEELVLEWERDDNFSESQKIVLDSLRPHTNLKSLAIKYYCGRSLSDWIGLPSFSKLAYLRLQNCYYCSSLPSLGQLPSLQNLSIVGFNEVVRVGSEFCGSGGSSSVNSFGALKVLKFEVKRRIARPSSFFNQTSDY
ncbi:putative disease resistance RPP13-like protein 1 [Corylus avellana]|uniref:putative disease resistance RPP13-like protein 1 n=1 Tax=Corylus avellana TaxID=13451 RepID=UPI00286BC43B|nr:putative disease resistance RPP13-like protein 1 [Corylus avellana]